VKIVSYTAFVRREFWEAYTALTVENNPTAPPFGLSIAASPAVTRAGSSNPVNEQVAVTIRGNLRPDCFYSP